MRVMVNLLNLLTWTSTRIPARRVSQLLIIVRIWCNQGTPSYWLDPQPGSVVTNSVSTTKSGSNSPNSVGSASISCTITVDNSPTSTIKAAPVMVSAVSSGDLTNTLMIIGYPSVSPSVQASFPKRSPTSFATAYPVHFVHPALYFARSETVFLMSGGTEALWSPGGGSHPNY